MSNFREISQAWDKQKADGGFSTEVKDWVGETFNQAINVLSKLKFSDVIPLNKELSYEEGVEVLMNYHNASKESILRAFINLRIHETDTKHIVFRKGINSSVKCIVIEGTDKDKKWLWNEPIDLFTGQPEGRCS